MRRKLLVTTALGLTCMFLLPGMAFAQQIPGYDWTGPYAGFTMGVVKSSGVVDFSYDYSPFFTLPTSVNVPSLAGAAGIDVGYNQQFGPMVIGIEADGSLVNLKAGTAGSNYSIEEQLSSLLSLRGKVGYSQGNLLFYATFGVAGGEASYSSSVSDLGKGTQSSASASGFATGLIGGAGLEAGVSDKVSLKVEALAYSLNSLSGTGDTGKGGFTAKATPAGMIVRGGANFHF